MNIGSTLKLLRVSSDLTQRSLAEDLNISANYLSLIENNRREPSLTFLKRFSKRLDAPLGYFLWLCLEENSSSEELVLKKNMDDLLVNIIRNKTKTDNFLDNDNEEKE